MTIFPSARHCAAGAGLCPGHDESAGKRRSGRIRKGRMWLRAALIEAGWANSHTRGYLAALYRRLLRCRGQKKALVAVAHAILEVAYCLLRDGTTYRDLGADYFEKRDMLRVQRRLVGRLEALGFRVMLEPLAHAA